MSKWPPRARGEASAGDAPVETSAAAHSAAITGDPAGHAVMKKAVVAASAAPAAMAPARIAAAVVLRGIATNTTAWNKGRVPVVVVSTTQTSALRPG